MTVFTAIDFETANRFRDSVCAIGAVRVERGKVVERYYRLVRPWTQRFEYTPLHGIAWSDVRAAPTFDRVWPELRWLLRGVDFVVAHNASFDMAVLAACCERAGVQPLDSCSNLFRGTRSSACKMHISRSARVGRPTSDTTSGRETPRGA